MSKELRLRLIVVVVVLGLATFLAIPWAKRPLFTNNMRYGLDLQGGTELLYRVGEMTEKEKEKHKGEDVASTIIRIINERVDAQGVKQFRIQKQGNDRVLIQLPGADQKETERLQKLIQTSGKLQFRLVALSQDAERFKDKTPPDRYRWLEYARTEGKGRELILIDDGWNLDGDIIKTAYESQDDTGWPAVGFEVHPASQDFFYDLSSSNSDDRLGHGNGRKLAIIMDGKIISAPVIRSGIRDHGIITGGEGGFKPDEQQHLITVLRYGSFPVALEFERLNFVGPGIGSDSIRSGIIASLIAGAAVFLFMVIYYMGLGLVANFALALNIVITVAAMNLLGATLTLPGIAGIALTAGMAVDANILIFERIREEKAKGKTLHQCLKSAYERAFVTIFDSNLTTLITSGILWLVGTGPVRGFAITLSIGIASSMFTAVFVTRVIFELLLLVRVVTQFRMITILRDPAYDWAKWLRVAVIGSALAIAAGILVFSYRGERNLGIDFREGTIVDFTLKKALGIDEVRQRISRFTRPASGTEGAVTPYADAEIQEIVEFAGSRTGATRQFEVRVGFKEKPEVVGGDVRKIFASEIGLPPFESESPADNVSHPSFQFNFQFQLRSETAVAEAEKALRAAFAASPLLLQGSPEGTMPGTVGGTGEQDTGRSHAKHFLFESRRIPLAPGAKPGELLEPLLNEARKRLGELAEIDGAFPFAGPAIERYADMTLKVNFLKEVDPAQVAEALKTFKEVNVEPGKGAPATAEFVLRAKDFKLLQESGEDTFTTRIADWQNAIRAAIKDQKIASNLSEPISRTGSISPIVAHELVERGIMALLLSMLAIVIYVAVRFQIGGVPTQYQGSGFLNFVREIVYRSRYGIAGVAVLAHDVLFTVGLVAIVSELGIFEVKVDLTILAAYLTIIGYSINDTIVIYDRIREDVLKGDKMDVRSIVNLAINQTLSRTILTSGTVFFSLLALFVFGGGVINPFAFTMLIGVIVGVYSTLYIAAPVIIWWEKLASAKPAGPPPAKA
jgi:protein-export membrane protein SecD